MLENVKWLLVVSRFFGCHPHTIGADVTSPRMIRIYSGLWYIIYLACALRKLLRAYCDSAEKEQIRCALLNVREIFYLLGLSIYVLVAIVEHEKLKGAYARARQFDDSTKSKNHTIVPPIMQQIGMIILLLWWIGYFSYIKIHNIHLPYDAIIIETIEHYVTTIEIVKFCLLLDNYRQRFRQLNKFITNGVITIKMKNQTFTKELTIHNVYDYYVYLEKGIGCLNSYFTIQLFIWLGILVLEVLAYVYIWVTKKSGSIFKECCAMIYSALHIFLLSQITHLTCTEANRFGKLLFSLNCPIYVNSKSTLDIVECGLYIYKRPIRIMVGDMFSADHSMMVVIIGCWLQYLIILLQL